MKPLIARLNNWGDTLPEAQKPLLRVLLTSRRSRPSAERLVPTPALRAHSVYAVSKALFTNVAARRIATAPRVHDLWVEMGPIWVEFPHPPWNNCYFAGPDFRANGVMRKGSPSAAKARLSFCRRLDNFSRQLPLKDQIALKALAVAKMHPLQRLQLFGTGTILSRPERLLISKLKNRRAAAATT